MAAVAVAQETPYVDNGPNDPWPGPKGFGAFVVQDARPFVVARIDPIVDPGKVSGHVHVIAGATNFRNVVNTPQEAQEAECTSVAVQANKSNYWYP